jgi:hypothetical protein
MATAFAASITVKVRDNCFRSLQNGSGGNAGVFANYARDTLGVGGTVTWLWTGAQRDSGFRFRVDVATRVAMLPNRKPRGLSVSEVG